jgi:ribosomal protein S18 acetylase RimI-like enzyme
MPNEYRIVELTGLHDELLPAWLDLYETSFPFNERLLVSHFIRLLQAKEQGEAKQITLSALAGQSHDLIGMAAWHYIQEPGIAYLWYIAICPEARSRGLGSMYYHAFLASAFAKGARLALFEVEKPELARDEPERILAQRRIDFYTRQGARLLTGIHYLQSVGAHAPSTPMHLMFHAKDDLSPSEAYRLASQVLGDALQQVGPLALEGG